MRNIQSSPWLALAGAGRDQAGAAAGAARSAGRRGGSRQRVHAEHAGQARGAADPGGRQARRRAGKPAPATPPKPAPARRRRRSRRPGRKGREGMTLDDLRRLNIREVGNWPTLPKVGLLAILFLVIVGLGAFFDWKDQYEALEVARAQEDEAQGRVQRRRRRRPSTTTSTSRSSRKSSSRSARWSSSFRTARRSTRC